MNQVVIFGNVKEMPLVKETSNGVSYCSLIIDCPKLYANSDGIIESETYCVTVWRNMIDEIMKYVEIGRPVAVRGRLHPNNFNKDDGTVIYRTEIIAEKVSFLTQS